MTEVLRTLGYEVIEVALGAETLAAVTSARPDAVLVDIGLPDIDGYEVARRLRADIHTRGVLIIALTGYGKLSGNDEPAYAGLFDAYFVKPVDVFELTNKVEALLAAGDSA